MPHSKKYEAAARWPYTDNPPDPHEHEYPDMDELRRAEYMRPRGRGRKPISDFDF